MELKNNYWIDENNNRWNAGYYSKEDAEKYSKGLHNCEGCYNCIDCQDCRDCSNCEDYKEAKQRINNINIT